MAIARAIVGRPRILLAAEPTGNLFGICFTLAILLVATPAAVRR